MASTLYGGVETGGSWCVCALGEGPGELAALETFRTAEPAATLERIAAFFAAHPGAQAVGVGAFGPVELDEHSPRWGEILASTPKRGWAGAPLGAMLRDRLGVPVVLDTDVNAAAVGEHLWGAGRGVQSLCYLTVGTGIGAGLIVDERPVHGLLHPEAGHLRIPHDRGRDPFPGSCAVHGDCWEGLASGVAIAERWAGDPATLPGEHPAWALEADYLAVGILAIVMIAAPQRVILGGGVMQRSGLRDAIAVRLTALLGGYLDRPELTGSLAGFLVPAELGDEAGVRGALALAARAV